jgi:dodecin
MSYGYDVRRDYGPMAERNERRPMRGGRAEQEESGAPIIKVIEVLAQSPHSWEDAARRAVAEASRTIRDIKSIYIKDMQAVVEDDDIVSFRINAKVSFAIDERGRGNGHGRRTGWSP